MSDSSKGEDNEEETNVEGSNEGEAANNKATEGDDAMPRDETMEDVFTLVRSMIESVDLKEYSTPIH